MLIQPINLRLFRRKANKHKRGLRSFLSRLKKNPPRGLDELAIRVDKEVWHETDCMSCANCCKTMSPTYSKQDILRISSHLNISEKEFKRKWLFKDVDGDWLNKLQPCQFLDLHTNMCSIYEIRPADCAGFPHLTKKRMVDYMHVHKQNLELCPATFRMVEKMRHLLKVYGKFDGK